MKRKSQRTEEPTPVYERIREILESARTTLARSVNTTQVVANWLVGREIVEEEQRGQRRAGYGEKLSRTLSKQITAEFGRGYSVNNLEHFRDFYVTYPELIATPIPHALRGESETSSPPTASICHATRDESFQATARYEALYAARRESWQPGLLHPNLSWTHYRTLLRVDKPEARAFYEIEAIENRWSARELERQINSLLYERLALSKGSAPHPPSPARASTGTISGPVTVLWPLRREWRFFTAGDLLLSAQGERGQPSSTPFRPIKVGQMPYALQMVAVEPRCWRRGSGIERIIMLTYS